MSNYRKRVIDLPEEDIYRQYFELDKDSIKAEYDEQVNKKFDIEKGIEYLQADSAAVSKRLRILDELRNKSEYT